MESRRAGVHLLIRATACACLLLAGGLAVAGDAPPPGIETAERMPAPEPSAQFPFAEDAQKNPNLCPRCGQSWDEDVHQTCFQEVTARQEKASCPSCGLGFYLERRLVRVRADQIDRDLCPHPPPGAPATPELAVCPRCGFASVRGVFLSQEGRRLPEDQQAWVAEHITPPTRQTILTLIGHINPRHRPASDRLYTIFDENATRRLSLPEEKAELVPERIVETAMPDDLRCRNALLFAQEYFADRNPLICARMAWLTAWAYRREVSGPIPDTLLIRAVRRINRRLEEALPLGAPPEKRVNELVKLYGEGNRHALVDRQVMLLMMAGDYQRLGFRQWSHDCLVSVRDAARSDALWDEAAKSGSVTETTAREGMSGRELARQRAALAEQAELRTSAARAEIGYLVDAAAHLRHALANEQVPTKHLRRYVYLAGEFDRRTGNFARAYAWLSVAARTLDRGPAPEAEVFAPEQVELVLQALGPQGDEAAPRTPDGAVDGPLLARRAARSTSAPRTAPAGGAAAPADAGRPATAPTP